MHGTQHRVVNDTVNNEHNTLCLEKYFLHFQITPINLDQRYYFLYKKESYSPTLHLT